MISIISGIYKSDLYLEKFLEHVKEFDQALKNSGEDWEFILVHTRSSPKELELIKTMQDHTWFKAIAFDELGVFGAWNTGVKIAKGEVMGFWNADDIRFPQAAIEALQLARGGADVIYFPFIIKRYLSLGPINIPVLTTKIEGEILKFDRRRFQIEYNGGPHFMFTKKAYELTGPFDEQFRIAGDFDWFARAASKGLNFALTKNYSGIFRVDGRGMSTGKNARLETENNVVFTRQKALQKLRGGDQAMFEQYHVDEVLYQGRWQRY